MSRTSAAARLKNDNAPAEASRAGVRPARGAASAPCQFEVVKTLAALEALGPEWDALFDRSARSHNVFQTFAWNRHWCAHYLGDQAAKLAIVTGRRNGRLVMLWPLVIERVSGVNVLTWMGEPVSQYGDVLVEHGERTLADLREGWEFAVRHTQPDLVWLQRVREDASIAPLLGVLGAHRLHGRIAPYIARAEADAVEADPARARKKRRALAKRLAKLGEVAFEQAADCPRASEIARRTIGWKQQQLQDRGLIAPAFDQRLAAFFADATSGEMPCGCRTVLLTSDGVPAAGGVFIACKGRMAGHIVAFDGRFEKAGVGILLLEQIAETAFADGFDTVDLLPPGDTYKERLAKSSVAVADWAIPLNGKGALYYRAYLGAIRPWLKAMFGRLPAPARRWLAARFSANGAS